MLSFPSRLTFAPIKLKKTEDDVFPVLHLDKHEQVLSFIFLVALSSVYFKVKVYDSLQLGKDFFIYIRSLSTFIEIACLVGNMLCYNFGARKTVRIYKKMKKMIRNHFTDVDYNSMYKLYVIELVVPGLVLIIQLLIYFYLYFHPYTILVFILDSNITILITATCIRHYNIAKMLQICLKKLLKAFEDTIDSKQLQQIWTSYLEIYSVIKSNNEFFGLSLSCSLAVLYVYCLIALFGICSFATVVPSVAIINVLWFCIELSTILIVIFGTCICELNAKKLQAYLGSYVGENNNNLEEVSKNKYIYKMII